MLPHLTDQDLKDLGVLLGHRRKILAAIHQGVDWTPMQSEVTAGIEPSVKETAER